MADTLSYGFVIDLVLLAFLVLTVFISRKKGLVLTLLDFAAFIVATIFAVELSALAAPAAYGAFISPGVLSVLESNLPETAASGEIAASVNSVLASFPEFVSEYALNIGIDINEISGQIASVGVFEGTLAGTVEANIVAPLVTAVCKAVLFVVLFIVLLVILKAVVRVINRFFKLPVLKQLNSTLGAVFGAVKGVAVIFVLASVLTVAADLLAPYIPMLGECVNDSAVISFINGCSPVTEFLS